MPAGDNARGGDGTKAYRLRKLLAEGKTLKPIDALWLSDYEETSKGKGPPRKQSFGASASGKKVKLEIEEHASSVGTGSAAAEAASAALMAKEEGRRLDALTINAVAALQAANATYRDVCLSMKDRLEVLEATHIAMLESVRAHFLSRVDVEAELREKAKDDGDDTGLQTMALALVAKQLGVDLDGVPGFGKKKATGKAS